MMEWMLSMFSLVAFIYLGLKIYDKVTEDYKAVIYAALAFIGICLMLVVFNPVFLLYERLNNLLVSSSNVSPLVGFLAGSGIIATLAILSARLIIRFFKVKSEESVFMVKGVAMIAAGTMVLGIYGKSVETMDYVFTVACLAALVCAFFLAKFWRRGKQDALAIIVGYIMNILMTYTLCWSILGISLAGNLTGSLADLAPFVVLNVAMATISWILTLPTFFKVRLSYKAIYFWTALLVVISLVTTVLVLTSYINKYELMALRELNATRRVEAEMRRKMSFGTKRNGYRLDEAIKAKEAAIKNNDPKLLAEASKSIEEHLAAQRANPNPELEISLGYSSAFKDVVVLVKVFIPSFSRGESAHTRNWPPPPPDYKIYQPGTYTFSLKAGEVLDPGIEFPYGRKTDYSINSSDNNYDLLYSDGDIVSGKVDRLPGKNLAKFKIKAITDQPRIVMVVK